MDSFRTYVANDLKHGIELLESWERDSDIRQSAVEATRPRGAWTAHIEAVKRDPALGPCS